MFNRKFVKICTIENIKRFAEIADKVEGDVICRAGQYTVNGKSILGLFSLDLTHGMIVEYPATATELDNFLMNFITEN